MNDPQDEKLNRLLREAFPAVGVSPDFTLRLWRRLMKTPARPPWMMPVPVYVLAAAVGILGGVWTWGSLIQGSSPLSQSVRWDLFGNAPVDTISGSYLQLLKEGGGA